MGTVWVASLLGLGISGEAITNVVRIVPSASSIPPSAAVMASVVDTLLAPLILACVTDDYKYQTTSVKRYETGAVVEEASNSDHFGDTGSNAGTPAPQVNCAILRLYSAQPGRHGRGRMFISPVLASLMTVQGNFDITFAPLADLGAALCEAFSAGGVQHNFAVGSSANLVAYPYDHFAVAPTIGVQRRRRTRLPT